MSLSQWNFLVGFVVSTISAYCIGLDFAVKFHAFVQIYGSRHSHFSEQKQCV